MKLSATAVRRSNSVRRHEVLVYCRESTARIAFPNRQRRDEACRLIRRTLSAAPDGVAILEVEPEGVAPSTAQ
ncbi:MAG: hypothetical protein ACLFS5_01775 [Spirochaetaceae bacterium]